MDCQANAGILALKEADPGQDGWTDRILGMALLDVTGMDLSAVLSLWGDIAT